MRVKGRLTEAAAEVHLEVDAGIGLPAVVVACDRRLVGHRRVTVRPGDVTCERCRMIVRRAHAASG